MTMVDEELAKEAQQYGYIGLVSVRDSMSEAYQYALDVAGALGSDGASMNIAVQVFLNTHAIQWAKAVRVIEELEELARATIAYLEQGSQSERRKQAMLDGATQAIANARKYVRISAKAPKPEDPEEGEEG